MLLLLLEHCRRADDCNLRREIMELVADLFDAHAAISSQVQLIGEFSSECLTAYELMEQVEGTDARSRLHAARSAELARALEAYVAKEKPALRKRSAAPLRLERTPGNRALLREHAGLVAKAQRLLRLH